MAIILKGQKIIKVYDSWILRGKDERINSKLEKTIIRLFGPEL